MPNTNKNKSSDLASNVSETASRELAPSISTAQDEQQKNIGRSDSTFNTADTGFKKFAETGGFSPSDETKFINRATQGVSGTYDVLENAAKRRRAATGGMGTGGDIAQLARQGTQEQAKATEGAQVDLHTMENQNKLAGLTGESALFDRASGQVTAMGQQILQALGLKYDTQEEAAKILAGLAAQPGTFSKILQTISVIGGANKNFGPN